MPDRGLYAERFKLRSALAKGDQWSFRLYAIRFSGDVYRFIFAAKQLTPEADRAFRYSVGTFRRMTQSEIESARPLIQAPTSACTGSRANTVPANAAGQREMI